MGNPLINVELPLDMCFRALYHHGLVSTQRFTPAQYSGTDYLRAGGTMIHARARR